jgi:hypothetical protein
MVYGLPVYHPYAAGIGGILLLYIYIVDEKLIYAMLWCTEHTPDEASS